MREESFDVRKMGDMATDRVHASESARAPVTCRRGHKRPERRFGGVLSNGECAAITGASLGASTEPGAHIRTARWK